MRYYSVLYSAIFIICEVISSIDKRVIKNQHTPETEGKNAASGQSTMQLSTFSMES